MNCRSTAQEISSRWPRSAQRTSGTVAHGSNRARTLGPTQHDRAAGPTTDRAALLTYTFVTLRTGFLRSLLRVPPTFSYSSELSP